MESVKNSDSESQAFVNSPMGQFALEQTRRQFLSASAKGIGTAALAALMNPAHLFGETLKSSSIISNTPHFVPKAKRVIYLYMAGGPSHLELFDYKKGMAPLNGQPMPESFTKGQPIAQLQGAELKVLAPQFTFSRQGKSGQMISDILPYTQTIADDICIIRSMVTEQINHDPAHTFMNTGSSISANP